MYKHIFLNVSVYVYNCGKMFTTTHFIERTMEDKQHYIHSENYFSCSHNNIKIFNEPYIYSVLGVCGCFIYNNIVVTSSKAIEKHQEKNNLNRLN